MQISHHRDETIDAFRGIAIISVIAFHYLVRWSPPFSQVNLVGLDGLYSTWWGVGRLGVELFFVVSGLVITMTLLRSHDVTDFVIKRFARLYPPFLFAVVLTTILLGFADPLDLRVGTRDFLVNLTMLPTIIGVKPVDGAYWSLAPELFFYFWAALSWWVLKSRFWVGLLTVAFVGVAAKFVSHEAGVLLLADHSAFFLMGVGLWFLVKGDSKIGVAVVSAATLLYIFNVGHLEKTGAPQWLNHLFLIGGIAGLTALLLLKPGLQWGALAWLGRISYSLYLIHQNLGVTFIRLLKDREVPDLIAIAVVVLTAIVAAWLMYNLVELPGQRIVLSGYRAIRGRVCSTRPTGAV